MTEKNSLWSLCLVLATFSLSFSYSTPSDGVVLFSGYVDKRKNEFTITYVSDALLDADGLRASAGGLACNLAMWGAGSIWGYAVGIINPVAGLAVGLAYTVASYYACDESRSLVIS